LLYDTVYNIRVVAVQDGMSKTLEVIIHHIVAVLALLVASLAGYSMVGVAGAFMLCEASSIFLSFKLMYDDIGGKRNTPLLVINQALFFITFTIVRIILFPFCGFHMVPSTMAVW
jgi:hypothetical protein